MQYEELELSSLLILLRQRIDKIKKNSNAFIADWALIELLEVILKKTEDQ